MEVSLHIDSYREGMKSAFSKEADWSDFLDWVGKGVSNVGESAVFQDSLQRQLRPGMAPGKQIGSQAAKYVNDLPSRITSGIGNSLASGIENFGENAALNAKYTQLNTNPFTQNNYPYQKGNTVYSQSRATEQPATFMTSPPKSPTSSQHLSRGSKVEHIPEATVTPSKQPASKSPKTQGTQLPTSAKGGVAIGG